MPGREVGRRNVRYANDNNVCCGARVTDASRLAGKGWS